jgi:hypothetical protein
MSGGDRVPRQLHAARVLGTQPTLAAVIAHAATFAVVMVNVVTLVPGIVGLALAGFGYSDLLGFSLISAGVGAAILPLSAVMSRRWAALPRGGAEATAVEGGSLMPPPPPRGPAPEGPGVPVRPIRPAPAMSASRARDPGDAE